jgi:hypothetical protein
MRLPPAFTARGLLQQGGKRLAAEGKQPLHPRCVPTRLNRKLNAVSAAVAAIWTKFRDELLLGAGKSLT